MGFPGGTAHSSIFTWEIPWTEELGSAWGCKRVRHDLATEQQNAYHRDFPGGPGAKTQSSQRRGPGLNPWSENLIPHAAPKTHTAEEINIKKYTRDTQCSIFRRMVHGH